MNIQRDIPLSSITTMRLGGPAKFYVDITSIEELRSAYAYARKHRLKTFIIGEGSNLLGRDEGFNGLIIHNQIKGIEIIREDAAHVIVRANSGEILDDLVAFSVKHKLSGIELLSSIPGSVGAAPVQNAGAYGQEIGENLLSVEVYDIATGKLKTLEKSELKLSYRRSIFNYGAKVGKYFITAITIRLNKTNLQPPFYGSLQAYLDEHKTKTYTPAKLRSAVQTIRAKKLPNPDKVPSAGSFFKNVTLTERAATELKGKCPDAPIYKRDDGKLQLSTAWMIDRTGLKGKNLFGFTISEKSPLVLVNTNATSYYNLTQARSEIIMKVHDLFGITISSEPQEII